MMVKRQHRSYSVITSLQHKQRVRGGTHIIYVSKVELMKGSSLLWGNLGGLVCVEFPKDRSKRVEVKTKQKKYSVAKELKLNLLLWSTLSPRERCDKIF